MAEQEVQEVVMAARAMVRAAQEAVMAALATVLVLVRAMAMVRAMAAQAEAVLARETAACHLNQRRNLHRSRPAPALPRWPTNRPCAAICVGRIAC
ncbi:MAG TPA: hypothetical protein VGC24_05215 [Burkholderiaceae bacterium]